MQTFLRELYSPIDKNSEEKFENSKDKLIIIRVHKGLSHVDPLHFASLRLGCFVSAAQKFI